MRTLLLLCLLLLVGGSLTAVASALTVTSISPAVAYADSSRVYDVYGTGFAVDAQVTLNPAAGGTAIAATGEKWVDSTLLRCTVAVPPGAVTGRYGVTVSNPKADSGTMADAFTVYPRPTVTSISPAVVGQPGLYIPFRITGTGFSNEIGVRSRFYLQGGTGGTTTISPMTYGPFYTSTTIEGDMIIPGDAYPGTYDLYVSNHPDLPYLLCMSDGFTILAPTPAISSVSPNGGFPGQTLTVNVTGSGFTNGAEVIVQGGPSGGLTIITATGETFINSTTLRCTLSIPADAFPGPYTVFLRNPGGEWVYKQNAFTVTGPSIILFDISPASAYPGETLSTVYITGIGFINGAEVQLQGGGGTTTIDATGETWINSSAIRCSLAIPANATPGRYNLFVRNIDNLQNATGFEYFTIPAPTPAVTTVSPSSAYPGQGLSTVHVYGTNFTTGARVTVYGGTSGTTTIHATDGTFVSPSEIRCSLAIPADAYPGPYTVRVTNPANIFTRPDPSGSKAGAFSVIAPTPTVTSISPSSGVCGETLIGVTVTGAGFANGAEVAIAGGSTWVDATGETWVSPIQLQCTLAIPANAHVGPYNAYVRNPGMASWVSIAGAFTVLAPPAVLAVPPGTSLPTDTDGDGKYEDINGNGRKDFADVVLYFNQMTWISTNEPVPLFDYNGNTRIDFADVVWLFNHL